MPTDSEPSADLIAEARKYWNTGMCERYAKGRCSMGEVIAAFAAREAAKERAAVVAWLSPRSLLDEWSAKCIERGEHRKGTP